VTINSFRDLRVWQAGMDLVEDVYRVTQAFPKQETYALTSQLQRAAVSVPSISPKVTRESTAKNIFTIYQSLKGRWQNLRHK